MAESSIHRVNPEFEDEYEGAQADATEVVINVLRAGERMTAVVESFIRARGVPSITALQVLEVLRGDQRAGNSGGLSPSVVAERSIMSRPALSGVMDTLERRGLLRRTPDANDRRRSVVQITDEGVALMDALMRDLHKVEVEWTNPLSANQKASLLRELGRLYGHLPRFLGQTAAGG